jgi:uncharacterized protein Usg
MLIGANQALITVDILYWMPNYNHILQEFLWQTIDIKPNYPRVNRFLYFWHHEIDAVIKEIRLMDSSGADMRAAFQLYDKMIKA